MDGVKTVRIVKGRNSGKFKVVRHNWHRIAIVQPGTEHRWNPGWRGPWRRVACSTRNWTAYYLPAAKYGCWLLSNATAKGGRQWGWNGPAACMQYMEIALPFQHLWRYRRTSRAASRRCGASLTGRRSSMAALSSRGLPPAGSKLVGEL